MARRISLRARRKPSSDPGSPVARLSSARAFTQSAATSSPAATQSAVPQITPALLATLRGGLTLDGQTAAARLEIGAGPAGSAVLLAVMDHLGAPALVTSTRGLRYGILLAAVAGSDCLAPS